MCNRLLFDTNVLLDAVMPGRPQHSEALRVIGRCNGDGDLGMTCPLSLKDAYYVLEREYDEPTARSAVDRLMGLLVVCPVGAEECDMSMRSNEPDFEDGLVRAVAELEDVDFIITRNSAAFGRSKVRAVTAGQYLEIAEAC